jgi:hypothetical protein
MKVNVQLPLLNEFVVKCFIVGAFVVALMVSASMVSTANDNTGMTKAMEVVFATVCIALVYAIMSTNDKMRRREIRLEFQDKNKGE